MFFPHRDFLYDSTLNLGDIIESASGPSKGILNKHAFWNCQDCNNEFFICHSQIDTQNQNSHQNKNGNSCSYCICSNALHCSGNQIILLNRFSLVRECGTLGSGNFTGVFLLQDVYTNNFYALKVVRRELAVILENEFRTLSRFLNSRPHLVPRPYRYFTSKRFCFLIQEILTPIPPFPTGSFDLEKLNVIRILVRDVATTLKYLHSQRVIHVDLKLANLMYRNSAFVPIPFSTELTLETALHLSTHLPLHR